MDIIRKNSHSRYTILYYESADIDGFDCREEFANLIHRTGSKRYYKRAHEWCCGHGAIGFKLLETGLCKHLVLTDKHQPATIGCEFTVALNDLHQHVSVYNSDSLGALPESEQWDLFVANPPWRSQILPGPDLSNDLKRKMFDIGWQVHADMWANIKQHVTDDADIYIYEDNRFSTTDTWQSDIDRCGLKVQNVYTNFGIISSGYVMHLKVK
jgi:hypothetical protein